MIAEGTFGLSIRQKGENGTTVETFNCSGIVSRVRIRTLFTSNTALPGNEPTTTKVPDNTTFVFIDASNLWQAQKAKGRFIDYEKAIGFIKRHYQATAVKVFYYTAYPADGTRSYSLDNKHKFFTFLKKALGFEVRKKQLKRITVIDEHGEAVIEKGNMDVELTIDAIHYSSNFQTAVLFTGDSDFLALVRYLKRGGKKVFILSSKNNISQELKTGGDGYRDLLDITEDIWGRELKRRAEIEKAA